MELMDLDKLEGLVFDFCKKAKGFSSDSRTCDDSKIFVALVGLNGDGHDYVEDLVQNKNCQGAIVSATHEAQLSAETLKNCLVVPDTHQAHRLTAKYFRGCFTAPVVAIGGSAGKTSTKEFLKTLCEDSYHCLVTVGSQNGDQGIPKTLEGLNDSVELAIIEVGIDAPGDMYRHMNIVKPSVGVLTSIGEEHLQFLHNVETVYKEESQLFDKTIEHNGVCFAPASDKYLSGYKSEKLRFVANDLSDFEGLVDKNSFPVIALQNLSLAIAVARHLGVPDDAIKKALAKIKPAAGRGRLLSPNSSQTLILDHYNSNPASLRAAFVTVREQLKSKTVPLYLILGDMLELGPDSQKFHKELLDEAIKLRPEEMVLVGPEFSEASRYLSNDSINAFDSHQSARSHVESMTNWPGLFLFKGSRGMKLENLITMFEVSDTDLV